MAEPYNWRDEFEQATLERNQLIQQKAVLEAEVAHQKQVADDVLRDLRFENRRRRRLERELEELEHRWRVGLDVTADSPPGTWAAFVACADRLAALLKKEAELHA